MLKEIIEKVLEDKWSQDVKTKWKPPKGTFAKETKPEDTAKTVCKGHKDLKSASASVDFYFNRKKVEPGDEKRRKEIIDILHKICKG